MNSISLEGLEFFAYHGYYEEERIIGNKYKVDVTVETPIVHSSYSDNLKDTINYVKIYKIVNKEMKIPSKMLEHIAMRILSSLYKKHSGIDSCTITISKFNPPIGGICHAAKISLHLTKQEFVDMVAQNLI